MAVQFDLFALDKFGFGSFASIDAIRPTIEDNRLA